MNQEAGGLALKLRGKISDNKSGLISLGIITLIVTLFCLELLTSSGLPAGTDLLLLPTHLGIIRKHSLWFSLWLPSDSFGYAAFLGPQFNFILSLFGLIQDILLATKLYVYAVFLLAGFSMYFFSRYYTKHNAASLLAAIVYIFNPIFILEAYAGHHTIISGYSLAPFLFLTYDRALVAGKVRNIVLSAFVLTTLFVAGHPHTTYIFGLFLALFALFEIVVPRNGKWRFYALKRVAKVSSLLIAFWVLLSAYEILPTGFSAYSSVYLSLGYTIEDAYAYSGVVYYPLLITLPLMVLLVFTLRKNRYMLFFSLALLFSALISMGPRPPFGEIFTWAFINIPFFDIFRVPYRFCLMAAFSISFIVAFAIATISGEHASGNSSGLQSRIEHKLHALRTSKRMLVTLALAGTIVVSSFYVAFGAFGFPLSTFDFPAPYIETYDWIGQQLGDYRILTVPYPAHYVDSSLISGVNRGWVWDPPVYGQALHGKTVITGYGGLVDTQEFLNFLGTQMLNNRTDDLMKLLGTFDTRYVIVHPYPLRDDPKLTQPLRAFFDFQKGLKTVYKSDNITVLENDYWTPHVFTAQNLGLIVGGRDVFTSLMKLDTFDLNQWALMFANQLGAGLFDELLENAGVLVLTGDAFRDSVMMSGDIGAKIGAVQYAFPSADPWKYWIPSSWWTNQGKLVINGLSLRTNGSNSVDIPFDLDSGGDYTLSLRVAFAPDRGNLAISLDGSLLKSLKPYSLGYSGFKWIDIEKMHIDAGRHILRLENQSPGLNDIDEIVISPTTYLESQIEKLTKTIATSPARIVAVLEAENDFTNKGLSDWRSKPSREASNGCALAYHYNRTSSRLSSDLFISRAGEYMFAARVRSGLPGKIFVDVDNSAWLFGVSPSSSTPGWEWVSFGPLNLTWGQHKVFIQSVLPSELDELVVYSVSGRPISVNDIFETVSTTHSDYEQVGPSEYVVHVDSATPFFVVLSESYHPLWKAYANGEEIDALPCYSFLNAFYLQGGNYDVTLKFMGQVYVFYGGLISLTSLVCLIIYFVFGGKFLSFIKKKSTRDTTPK